jgi:ketosteroid isomerase-like protein
LAPQVAASGDLAYMRGHCTMTMTYPATRKPATRSGSYLTVWKKQADGGWKALEDFVTPGPETGQ